MESGDKYPTKSLGFSWQSTINICFWVKLNKFLIDYPNLICFLRDIISICPDDQIYGLMGREYKR